MQTCQKRISCTALLVGIPSGHIGITMYAAKGSLAAILLAIFKAISIGTRLFAPDNYIQYTNIMQFQ